LNGLINVHLYNTQIKEIPQKVAEKFDWLNRSLDDNYPESKGLLVSDNSLTFPPISVIELGPETVRNYYETAEEYGHAHFQKGVSYFLGMVVQVNRASLKEYYTIRS